MPVQKQMEIGQALRAATRPMTTLPDFHDMACTDQGRPVRQVAAQTVLGRYDRASQRQTVAQTPARQDDGPQFRPVGDLFGCQPGAQ